MAAGDKFWETATLQSWSKTLTRLSQNAGIEKREFQGAPLFKRVWLVGLLFLVAVFLVTAFFGGGDALHGRKVNGHFFMAHNQGAPEHEVSSAWFYTNLWALRLLACMWAIGMVIGIREALKRRKCKNST